MENNYDNLTTDELYELLPEMIRYRGGSHIGEYHLSIHKGNRGTYVQYKNMERLDHLGDTYTRQNTLREAIIYMLDWLKRFNYSRNGNF